MRPPSWHRIRLGDEHALEAMVDGVRYVFGLGPSHPVGAADRRAAALLSALGDRVRAVRWCQQVHRTTVASLGEEPGHPFTGALCVGRCDGLITAEPGVALAVWTADCVPVLLAGGGVVAAVHAGWRGVAAGIVPTVVRRLQVEYGVAPTSLRVILGPAVGRCHYPVGPEVVVRLQDSGVDPRHWEHSHRVDLRAFLTAQLDSLGVGAECIIRVAGCTACSPELASYRRDGDRAGRQFSLIVRSA
jgi:YfiH family protein